MIGGEDFSEFINQKTYNIQRKDVFGSWEDGNWITHRNVVRTQVSGSFTMTFSREEDHDAFIDAVAAAKTAGGYCEIDVFVDTDKTFDTINAFLEIEAKHRWTMEAFGQTPELAVVTVKITEK